MEENKLPSEEKYLKIYRGRVRMLIDNFLGGIAWSLGTIVGAGFVLVVVGLILTKINFNLIPIVGTFVAQVFDFVQKEIAANLNR